MPTLTNALGQVVDLDTGEIVGRSPEAAVQRDPRAAGGPDVELTGADRVQSLVNNLSWGFNSALFALPDAAQRFIGRGLGLNDDQVFQFSRLFNRGEKAPVNSEGRYARAIGEGIGAGLPFTGLLAYAAKVSPMVGVAGAAAPSGVFREIARDAIKFAQNSPRAAAAMDVAFGAGYETLRQAVEETVDPSNEYKQLYKELLPAAAFIGAPLALSALPSVRAAKAVSGKIRSATSGLGAIEKETLEGLPALYRMPVVRVVPTTLMKNAERKLAQVFGPIAESKEAQEALKQLEQALTDPRIAQAGFMFDAAEQTMYAPLLQRKAELLNQLGPKELEATKARINENQKKFETLMSGFAPQARQAVEDAFRAAQAERQSLFENLLTKQKDLTEAEVAAISERLGPQNIDLLNDELRGVLISNMEMDYGMRKQILDDLGFRQGYDAQGLPVSTRGDDGSSLFDAVDIEKEASDLIGKYRVKRPSMGVRLPEPIARLESFVKAQQFEREKQAARNLDDLIRQKIVDETDGKLPEELMELTLKNVKSLFTKKGVTKKQADALAREMNIQKSAGIDIAAMKEGDVAISTGIPGRSIIVNPKQLQEDALRMAEDSTKVDLNLPEALDYLQSAIRYRNDSLASYNSAMQRGRTRLTDAQTILDRGKAVFDDVESLVLNNVPKISEEYGTLKSVIDNYKAQYEKSLPLLMAQQTRKGEFLLPNERLLQKAFESAQGIRQLRSTFGDDPEVGRFLLAGTVDWLRGKGVVDQAGLVNPAKIRSVLSRNQNIVDALPESIQTRLQDEVSLADEYVKRMGDLDKRRVSAQNNELDNFLARATRQDADARQSLARALQDPALMRNLVDVVKSDAESLAALRRAVFDVATEGAAGGGALRTFLDRNEKSLKVLFDGTKHFDDLKTLADLQRRVNAFSDVTGQIPAFESLDEAMKRTFGSGIQWLTTTAREAASGRINPNTGALALMVRLAGSLENTLYQRIFTKALEDPTFASQITRIGTPADALKAAAKLADIGISPTTYVPTPVRISQQSLAQTAMGDQQSEIEGMRNLPSRGPSAREMMRSLPPAPPVRGLNLRMPSAPPATPQGPPNVPLMYPALFPNDPIAAMLQQRQMQMQQPQGAPR